MEIAPGVHSLGQAKGGHVHAFLVDDGDGLTAIDTLYDPDGKRMLDQIRALGKTPRDLKRIILTHAHRSHLGGLMALKEQSGATVYAHAWEADIISGDRKAQGVLLRPVAPLRVYYLQLALFLGLGRHRKCPIDQTLKDGDHVGPLQVIGAPGHTPGHLAFHWPERNVLFAGDSIATWPSFSAGWAGFTLNFPQSRASLGRLADVGADVVAVGHGEPITAGGAEKVRSLLNVSIGAEP